jgi:hypothetical protein
MAIPGGEFPQYSGYPSRPAIRFEAIGEAWQFFTQQMGTWILAIVATFVIQFGVYIGGALILVMLGIGAGALTGKGNLNSDSASAGFVGGFMLGYFLLLVTLIFVSSFLMVGLYRMAAKQVRGEYISLGDLFTGTDALLPVLGATLLISLATMAASLTIVGGFVVAGLFSITIPLIVDRRQGVLAAMGSSWNALKGEWLMATLFHFVLVFVAGIGVLGLGVGLLFTYPLLFLGTAIVYRDFFPTAAPGQERMYAAYSAQNPPPPPLY